jgi:hypothetical protein
MEIMAFDLEAVSASRNYNHLQKQHMTENTYVKKESDNTQS